MDKPIISVVLGSYNRKRLLRLCIESIRKNGITVPYEIIVVDGGSNDGTIEWLTKQKDVISIVQHNRGKWKGKALERRSWGYFMNLAFKSAQGKYVCMLSDDCLVVPGAIGNGAAFFEKRLSDGINLGAVPFYFVMNYPRETDYVVIKVCKYVYVNHGLFLNEALRSVGYADEESYKFYAADVDLCYRMISKGYCIEACPDSKVIHVGHVNAALRRSNNSLKADAEVFETKWSHMLDSDYWVPKVHTLPNGHFNKNDLYKRSVTLYLMIIRSRVFIELESAKIAITRYGMLILGKMPMLKECLRRATRLLS